MGNRMKTLKLVNPHDRNWCENNYIITVGCGQCPTYLRVWASDLQAALDIAADNYIDEEEPGLFVEPDYPDREDFESEDDFFDAVSDCERDLTRVGNYGKLIGRESEPGLRDD